MRSFRSKPVGWRYESARHSLAAKGVKSSNDYFSRQTKLTRVCPFCKENTPHDVIENSKFSPVKCLQCDKTYVRGDRWVLTMKKNGETIGDENGYLTPAEAMRYPGASSVNVELKKKYFAKKGYFMTKFFGEVNGVGVKFNSVKELRAYPFKEDDKLIILGHNQASMHSVQDVKEYVGAKSDEYGYSVNVHHKDASGKSPSQRQREIRERRMGDSQ